MWFSARPECARCRCGNRLEEMFDAMIVCSCNIISDRDVRACVKPCGASADRARDVFRHLGCMPKCGRCVRSIQSMFEREASVETTLAKPSESRDFVMALAAE
jgi:bacterioferritin-associated ferredoxin